MMDLATTKFGPDQSLRGGAGVQCGNRQSSETSMKLFADLFSSDVGLMSAGVIAITLGLAVFYVRYFLRHMHEDEAKAAGR